jgi:hypothetical protein
LSLAKDLTPAREAAYRRIDADARKALDALSCVHELHELKQKMALKVFLTPPTGTPEVHDLLIEEAHLRGLNVVQLAKMIVEKAAAGYEARIAIESERIKRKAAIGAAQSEQEILAISRGAQ